MSFLVQYFSFNVLKKNQSKPEGLIQSHFFFFQFIFESVWA